MDLKPYQASPLKNETTGEYIPMGNYRITRGVLHRILKAYGVQHHPGSSLGDLKNIMIAHNIPFDPIPPGEVPDKRSERQAPQPESPRLPQKQPEVQDAGPYAEDGWPKNMGILKKMAKERGLKTYNTDKRKDIVKKLDEYMAGL